MKSQDPDKEDNLCSQGARRGRGVEADKSTVF